MLEIGCSSIVGLQPVTVTPPVQSELARRADSTETFATSKSWHLAEHMQSAAENRGMAWWLRTILIGRKPGFTLIRIGVLILGTFVLFKYVLLPPVRITGPSMSPTLRDGSVRFVNRLAYVWHEPRRGDIVSIRFAGNSVMYMKRIVGEPGETVEFSNGRLLINGEPLDEPYVKSPCRWNREPRKLGPDEYFVVGDNRSMSMQDHDHGVATRDRIVGKLLL